MRRSRGAIRAEITRQGIVDVGNLAAGKGLADLMAEQSQGEEAERFAPVWHEPGRVDCMCVTGALPR